MSKSTGNVIYADTLVDFFGVDAVRYFVLHEMPFENDGVITWELMVERLNSDLANILGNLVKRTVSMTNQYFGGVVADKGVTEPVDEDLKKVVLEAVRKVDEKMDKLRVADAITEIFNIFRRSNKYLTRQPRGFWQRKRTSRIVLRLFSTTWLSLSRSVRPCLNPSCRRPRRRS